jgi:phytoene desaturase
MPVYHKAPRKDSYDVIVIGGGMAGLSAGAGLAHQGADVLVVEAHYHAGGYAHAFRRKQFLFDSAVHLTPGGGPGGGLRQLLEAWGVDHLVDFLPVQPMYRTMGPGLLTNIRSGKEEFIESHAEHFPHERAGIRSLVETMDRMAAEIRELGATEVPPSQMMRMMVKRCPTVLRNSNRTLQRLLDDHVKDPLCQSVLSTLWTYLGLPPSRCSAVAFAVMMMSFVNEHAYYVRGTFQRLADAFVAAIEKFGGEVVMPRRVDKILLDERGHAAGIKLDKGGEEIRARYVISAADAFQTFLHMIGPDRLDPQFAASLETRGLSISAFEVFLGVKLDLAAMGVVHETFFAPCHSAEQVYDSHASGEVLGCGLSIPSIEDPSVAPPGHHTVCITMFAPWAESWKEEKQRLTDRLIDEAEEVIPGLRAAIVYSDSGTPTTMQRYSGNTRGAIYGWDATPKSLATRLAMETPVPGLFLAGHWTRPGGGLYAVVTSGQIAARRVLKELEQGRAGLGAKAAQGTLTGVAP